MNPTNSSGSRSPLTESTTAVSNWVHWILDSMLLPTTSSESLSSSVSFLNSIPSLQSFSPIFTSDIRIPSKTLYKRKSVAPTSETLENTDDFEYPQNTQTSKLKSRAGSSSSMPWNVANALTDFASNLLFQNSYIFGSPCSFIFSKVSPNAIFYILSKFQQSSQNHTIPQNQHSSLSSPNHSEIMHFSAALYLFHSWILTGPLKGTPVDPSCHLFNFNQALTIIKQCIPIKQKHTTSVVIANIFLLRHCLELTIDSLCATPFNPEHQQDLQLLNTLWKKSESFITPTPSQTSQNPTSFDSIIGEHWCQRFGFQNPNPSKDFRSLGLFTVQFITYLLNQSQDPTKSELTQLVSKMFSSTQKNRVKFSFALFFISVTSWTRNLLALDLLNGLFYSYLFCPDSNFNPIISPIFSNFETLSTDSIASCLTTTTQLCVSLYIKPVHIFSVFDHFFAQISFSLLNSFTQFWIENHPFNILDFSLIEHSFLSGYSDFSSVSFTWPSAISTYLKSEAISFGSFTPQKSTSWPKYGVIHQLLSFPFSMPQGPDPNPKFLITHPQPWHTIEPSLASSSVIKSKSKNN